MRFIGDVHGKWNEYLTVIDRCDKSIQVGDFGLGFDREELEPNLAPNHRFIRGNHDSPTSCAKHSGWIADGTQEGNMFFLGGAESIDRHMRVEGVSWWRDEQISQEVAWDITGKFYNGELTPKIVVTHDCPWSVALKIFGRDYYWLKNEMPSTTQQVLDSIFESYQPKLWIFGHWHEDRDEVIDGTRFICLGELSYIDVDLETLEVTWP